MRAPSVDEIVAWLERRLDDGMNPVYLPPAFAAINGEGEGR